jgi:hypothetical protein
MVRDGDRAIRIQPSHPFNAMDGKILIQNPAFHLFPGPIGDEEEVQPTQHPNLPGQLPGCAPRVEGDKDAAQPRKGVKEEEGREAGG